MGEAVIVVAGLAVLCVVLASMLRRRRRGPGRPRRAWRARTGGGRSQDADIGQGDGGDGGDGGGDGGGGD